MGVTQLTERLENYNLTGLSERMGQLDAAIATTQDKVQSVAAATVTQLTERLENYNLSGLDERMGQLDAAIAKTQDKVQEVATATVTQLAKGLEKYNLGGLSERIGQLDTSVTKAMAQAVAQNADENNKTAEAVDRLTKRLESAI